MTFQECLALIKREEFTAFYAGIDFDGGGHGYEPARPMGEFETIFEIGRKKVCTFGKGDIPCMTFTYKDGFLTHTSENYIWARFRK